MNLFLSTLLSYILLYRYAALFAINFLAAFALPIPSGAAVMASAAFASQGYFSFIWVVVVASLGNIIGDNINYWLVRRYGIPALRFFGLSKVYTSEQLLAVETFVKRWPAPIIFFSRFEVVSTILVNIVSGLGKLSYIRYLLYEVTGEITQVLAYAALGYVFGNNWETVNTLVGRLFLIIAAALILLAIVFWNRLIRRVISKKS